MPGPARVLLFEISADGQSEPILSRIAGVGSIPDNSSDFEMTTDCPLEVGHGHFPVPLDRVVQDLRLGDAKSVPAGLPCEVVEDTSNNLYRFAGRSGLRHRARALRCEAEAETR